MSRSNRRWYTVLVLRGALDSWTRDRPTTGAVLVRDVLAPPEASTDPVTGEQLPAGWAGCLVSPSAPPGVCEALGILADASARRRVGVRAHVATLTGSTVAEWRAQLPAVVAGVRDASVGWGMPRTVVLTRARSAQLEADILARWPGIRVVWAGPQSDAKPTIRLDDVAEVAK